MFWLERELNMTECGCQQKTIGVFIRDSMGLVITIPVYFLLLCL